jgi:hypothetical protein
MPGFLQLILHSNSLNQDLCALREKIHSRDPSQLISTGNNELGFQGIAPPGARGLAYIALYEASQPLDQTNLDL